MAHMAIQSTRHFGNFMAGMGSIAKWIENRPLKASSFIIFHTGVRFCSKLLLARHETEQGHNNCDVVSSLLDTVKVEGVPVCCDKGYSTNAMIAECTQRKLPFVGTMIQNRLQGNHPIFPDGEKGSIFK